MNTFNHKKIYRVGTKALWCAVFLFAFVLQAHAATLEPLSPGSFGTGDTVVIPIILNSNNEIINAIEGNLHYPASLTLKEIRDGSSLITFWVDRPSKENGFVHFSGITPGGISGSGEIFSLVFTAKGAGKSTFTLDSARALLNDGQGTETSLTIKNGSFIVGEQGSGKTVADLRSDTVPPDTFVPIVSSNPNLFDGKLIVIFATQDKGSGIDHYEVAERMGLQTLFVGQLQYVKASSPYLLTDQSLRSYIYVRAVDKAGNARVSMLPPQNLPFYYDPNYLGLILILLLTLGFFIFNYVRAKKR